jgi:hypothetical protein
MSTQDSLPHGGLDRLISESQKASGATTTLHANPASEAIAMVYAADKACGLLVALALLSTSAAAQEE